MAIKVQKLPWEEINRILDILNYSPCQVKEGDAELMAKTGLFQWYDDEKDTVEKSKGAEESFIEYVPQPRVRDKWRLDKVLPCEEGQQIYSQRIETQQLMKTEEMQQKIKYDSF